MKPFTKRLALVMGLLLTALICMGIVYIDTTQNFWSVSGGLVRLTVSNNISTITVSTNAPHGFGWNTNNINRSFIVAGRKPATNAAGNGASANVSGAVVIVSGGGGETLETTTAAGGLAGPMALVGGEGGNAPFATTNATGGTGGAVTVTGGAGAAVTGGVATNATTGGNGGALTLGGGAAGAPNTPSTNTVGGAGGSFTFNAAPGGTPTAGWARKGGQGGSVNVTAGLGGSGTRTNGGNGGGINYTAGNGGSTTSGGDPGAAGAISFTAGNGAVGATNSNGGSIYTLPGVNSGAAGLAGNVVVGRNAIGTSAGGLMIGPLVASSASVTNLLSATATLDFPSTVAGAVSDMPITVASAADGDPVYLSVPIAAVTNCMWMAWASNGVVYVRCANTQLVSAQDPNSGSFRVVVNKFR